MSTVVASKTESIEDGGSHAAAQVARRLRNSPYREIRGIRCEYHDGVLKLTGRLPLFFHKQLAQQAFAGLTRDVRIEDEIEVAG